MEDFRVTREMVQELAETGAVQLTGLEPPQIRVYESQRLDRLIMDDDFRVVGEVVWSILALSGLIDSNPMVDLKYVDGLRRVLQHQDRGGHMDGLTILWDVKSDDESSQLRTYGRGDRADHDNIRVFRYVDGPIALAQKGFGVNILDSTQDSESCWHSASRDFPSDLNVAYVDFMDLFEPKK